MKEIIVILVLSLVLGSCGSEKESITKDQSDIDYDILLKGDNTKISYINQARPVLEKRCIVCHGCYDAPCQLKLTSIEGIVRGANPKKVYNAERILAAEPTRMFVDANTEEEWREKGFHTVLNTGKNNTEDNLRNSVLYKMLRLKQLNPQPRTGMIDNNIDLGLSRDQTCPVNEKFDDYEKKFPTQGMPFATPNLSDDEYHVLVKWISQGLPDDSENKLPKSSLQQIKKWEMFLNQPDLKHRLVSRYIYEHLFLGHLYFKDANTREFFQLVRSYTPPGEAIKVIPTLRVYDDPGVEKFYYRLRYYKSSIVDKTHVVYELSEKRMDRYKELFINKDYKVSKLPSYSAEVASNPVKSFSDLPVKSRYEFLLDDSRFFIEGFIKGPVCRGQVALNVIEDNFWVFFSDPDKFRINNENKYLDSFAEQLDLPAGQGNTLNIFSVWTNYWERQKKYMLMRQDKFINTPKMHIDSALSYIWDGENGMDKKNNALTVFRHFDSATVKQGLHGDYPDSAWVLDYPMLERIHYVLVAGYDVYGNVGHQFNTRIYMDFIRMEGENTFLSLLPVKQRNKLRDSWYMGIRENLKKYFKEPEEWLNVEVVYGYKTDNPQRELYKRLEQRLTDASNSKDSLNRCYNDVCKSSIKKSNVEKQMQRIAKIKGERLVVFSDIALLKVKGKKQSHIYTLINNKGYKNISSLLDGVDGRDRSSDTLTIYEGILGAYPNFFFVVDETEISQFADNLLLIKNRDDYERFVSMYGVRRTSSSFWKEADWFSEQYAKQDPVAYGIFDLYRYNNR